MLIGIIGELILPSVLSDKAHLQEELAGRKRKTETEKVQEEEEEEEGQVSGNPCYLFPPT